mmetsp:Transcript_2898/g.8088  ORF Transcript_2898/g.8088 Transcript_2898/m.8088 type:complete len:118 (-) Transcript_2898:491-844(-)
MPSLPPRGRRPPRTFATTSETCPPSPLLLCIHMANGRRAHHLRPSSASSAVWLEASEGQWAVASTLAHVAVATHYSSGTFWQQWMEIEEMNGDIEFLFRLRALASAAGVRLGPRLLA